jgi:hypothetical protein
MKARGSAGIIAKNPTLCVIYFRSRLLSDPQVPKAILGHIWSFRLAI